jgi:hypothetical protein
MDSHSGANYENVLISKTFQRLSEAVMLIQVLTVKQGDLYYWHTQWILLWIESWEKKTALEKRHHPGGIPPTSHKPCPDTTMVKTPFDSIDLNPSSPQFFNNLFGNLPTALVRILVLADIDQILLGLLCQCAEKTTTALGLTFVVIS